MNIRAGKLERRLDGKELFSYFLNNVFGRSFSERFSSERRLVARCDVFVQVLQSREELPRGRSVPNVATPSYLNRDSQVVGVGVRVGNWRGCLDSWGAGGKCWTDGAGAGEEVFWQGAS